MTTELPTELMDLIEGDRVPAAGTAMPRPATAPGGASSANAGADCARPARAMGCRRRVGR